MTTEKVVSVTDELIAELEALANNATPGQWVDAESSESDLERWVMTSDKQWSIAATHSGIDSEDCHFGNAKFISAANPATILALLAERVELKRDAERYRWLREQEAEEGIAVLNVSGWERPATCWALTYPSSESLDAAIDAAMQS